MILKDFIKLIDLNHFVTSRKIKEILQRALPKREYISSDDVVNAQLKARLLIKQIKSKGKLIETFHYNINVAHGLIRGLNTVKLDIINQTIRYSKEIVEDYLQDPNHKIKFLAILDKLGTIDLGFAYNFCMDNEKKLLALFG